MVTCMMKNPMIIKMNSTNKIVKNKNMSYSFIPIGSMFELNLFEH